MSDHTLQQHLIDPEICIRCNTCEATCPVGAVTHDDRNYVVDADKCNHCMACVPPCPTGSIDNWRTVLRVNAYSVSEQLTWDVLPEQAELSDPTGPAAGIEEEKQALPSASIGSVAINAIANEGFNATVPPWSAAHAYTNLYGPKAKDAVIRATCTGNLRVTEVGAQGQPDYDTHHIVLDFGSVPFPVLEGQSIGVIAPGLDARGIPHHARQYSVASARNGERAGYNNLSLTVKRVLEDHDGKPVRGVASNFLCDLKVGDTVDVIGPFGASFLMPNHPGSHIVMICTGTGSAPMRAMTEWRRRLANSKKFDGGKLMLFFGARSQAELPYFGPLQKLPKDFIDIELCYSREANSPKRYVQDAMRERSADLAALLKDGNTHFYVCGLKAMETGVLGAFKDIAEGVGLNWQDAGAQLQREGRLHLETY
jgi:benzoyl-CoA 2,3-epoxidase subunit A